MALEKDEEQVSFINMRITTVWESHDEDDEVGAKHVVDTEHFQTAYHELIPLLVGEPGEIIKLDDEPLEDPTIASLTRVDNHAEDLDESPKKDDEKNNEDILIAM